VAEGGAQLDSPGAEVDRATQRSGGVFLRLRSLGSGHQRNDVSRIHAHRHVGLRLESEGDQVVMAKHLIEIVYTPDSQPYDCAFETE
jgi:hypothetical protein